MAKQLSIFEALGKRNPQKRSAESKAANARIYEQKRQRKFVESWRNGRPWLSVSDDGDTMFCNSCKDNAHGLADVSSSMARGSKAMRLDTVTAHERSVKHQRESEAIQAAAKPAETPGFRMLFQMNKKRLEMLNLKFRNVHALAKHNRPFTDYIWMNVLDGIKGHEITNEYKSDKTAAEFAFHIAEVEREHLQKDVSKANFFSIIMDGSTDTACTEQEIVYIRTCTAGSISVKFLAIVDTPKADADGIVRSLEKAIHRGLGESIQDLGSKLVAMGSDGAAVMMGRNNGVVKKLQDTVAPSLVGVHCFAHRLELACKDVVKEHPEYDGFMEILNDIYVFYKSNLNRVNLKTTCSVLDVRQLVPSRVGGTRWLPHTLRALNNLWTLYPAMIQHLKEVKEHGHSQKMKTKASGLLKKLTTIRTVEFGHLLWDVVITLSQLSLALQKRECCAAEVSDYVDAATVLLEKYAAECGPKLSKVRGLFEYQGVTLTDETRRIARDSFEDKQRTMCEDLVESISNRFDMDEQIISATGIVNKKSWPDKLEDEKDFGDEKVNQLVQHFNINLAHAEVKIDQILPQWTVLKALLYKRKSTSFRMISWAAINQQYSEIAPDFLQLVDIIFTIPATSAEAERGFSTMKVIKTDSRNRLKESSLNTLFRIKLLSPEESLFDPLPAINHWMAAAKRRVRNPAVAPADPVVAHVEEEDDELEESDNDQEEINLSQLLDDA